MEGIIFTPAGVCLSIDMVLNCVLKTIVLKQLLFHTKDKADTFTLRNLVYLVFPYVPGKRINSW